MLGGSWVGISCLRRQALAVVIVVRASISTTTAARSIGKSVLYDLTSSPSSGRTAGSSKKKLDKARTNVETTHRRSKESMKSKGSGAKTTTTSKDRSATTATTGSMGFVKVDRKAKARNASAQKPVKSITSEMAEAKRKQLQTRDTREKLTEKLNDKSFEPWQRRKIELKLKLKEEGWNPEKKIATSSMEKIRLLNAEFPDVWTMQRLSKQFKVSQEAIRRILKSKFQPSETHTKEREAKRKELIKKYKSSQSKQDKAAK